MVLFLRDVTEEDDHLLFEWANSDDVRKNALDPHKIRWSDHKDWFKAKLDNPHSKIFILENENCPIGQIRYDQTEKGFWEIDFFIEKRFRGLGLGTKIIELSVAEISAPIRAIVKKNNLVSCKIFKKLGFEEVEKGEYFEYILKWKNL